MSLESVLDQHGVLLDPTPLDSKQEEEQTPIRRLREISQRLAVERKKYTDTVERLSREITDALSPQNRESSATEEQPILAEPARSGADVRRPSEAKKGAKHVIMRLLEETRSANKIVGEMKEGLKHPNPLKKLSAYWKAGDFEKEWRIRLKNDETQNTILFRNDPDVDFLGARHLSDTDKMSHLMREYYHDELSVLCAELDRKYAMTPLAHNKGASFRDQGGEEVLRIRLGFFKDEGSFKTDRPTLGIQILKTSSEHAEVAARLALTIGIGEYVEGHGTLALQSLDKIRVEMQEGDAMRFLEQGFAKWQKMQATTKPEQKKLAFAARVALKELPSFTRRRKMNREEPHESPPNGSDVLAKVRELAETIPLLHPSEEIFARHFREESTEKPLDRVLNSALQKYLCYQDIIVSPFFSDMLSVSGDLVKDLVALSMGPDVRLKAITEDERKIIFLDFLATDTFLRLLLESTANGRLRSYIDAQYSSPSDQSMILPEKIARPLMALLDDKMLGFSYPAKLGEPAEYQDTAISGVGIVDAYRPISSESRELVVKSHAYVPKRNREDPLPMVDRRLDVQSMQEPLVRQPLSVGM